MIPTPPHIRNLYRASEEAGRKYQAACDNPAIDRDMLKQYWLAVEILTDIYSHEYRDPLNWVEPATGFEVAISVAQPAQLVSNLTKGI